MPVIQGPPRGGEAKRRCEDDITAAHKIKHIASAAIVQSFNNSRADAIQRLDAMTRKNTLRNGATVYPVQDVVYVSGIVFEDESVDERLAYLKNSLEPEDDVPFWLVPREDMGSDRSED